MGLGITLQDESGAELDTVVDPKNFLGTLLPEHGDPAHPMLASVDFYGDTVFNRMQMDRFLAEWTDIATKASTPEERALVSAIEGMAHRCQDEVHLYLKFIGD
jgi:hypothetical protein